MSTTNVCIIGAGVVGLSIALSLAEKHLPSSNVKIGMFVVMAESFYEMTTSYGSGGYWEPYKIEGTPDDVINLWGKSTFDHFQALYDDPVERVVAGVRLLDSYHLFDKEEEIIIPSWKHIVTDFRVLTADDLADIGNLVPPGSLFPVGKTFHGGLTFKSFTVDQSYYLKYLKDRLVKLGVEFRHMKIDSVDDVCHGEFNVVVNCCGIQGSKVSGDDNVCKPIRGQVVRIRAPLMQSVWFWNTSYIIPNMDTIVCGGTAQVDDWNLTESVDDTKTIMEDICALFPSVTQAPVDNVWVGLRPSRVPLRLSSEITRTNSTGAEVLVCHCYGHGGSGVTLSWGCAEDLVQNHIKPYFLHCSS